MQRSVKCDIQLEGAGEKPCYIITLSNEILLYISLHLDAKTATSVCQTCRRLRNGIRFSDPLWKRRCKQDFDLDLPMKSPFKTFYDIYRLVSMSRTVTRIYLSERFYSSGKYGVLPGWLWTWVVLNSSAPELPSWIRDHREPFFRLKMRELPLGRIQRVWNLAAQDFYGVRAVRNERGTIYYNWTDVHRVFIAKHGGTSELIAHSLKRCSRASKHVEKHFTELKQTERARERLKQTFIALLPQNFFSSIATTGLAQVYHSP